MLAQRIIGPIGSALAGLVIALAAGQNAVADESTCPLPNQKQTLVVQLFFGQSIKNRGPVTPKEWNSFLRRKVTPLFPDGFTVYDAHGQWLNTETHLVSREHTKVIVIATEDTPPIRINIAEVSDAYRKIFHQQSVGIVTNQACSAF